MPSAQVSHVMPSTVTVAVDARHLVGPAVRGRRFVGQQAGDLEPELRRVAQPSDSQLQDRLTTADRPGLAQVGRPMLHVDHHAVGSEELCEGDGIVADERGMPPAGELLG